MSDLKLEGQYCVAWSTKAGDCKVWTESEIGAIMLRSKLRLMRLRPKMFKMQNQKLVEA